MTTEGCSSSSSSVTSSAEKSPFFNWGTLSFSVTLISFALPFTLLSPFSIVEPFKVESAATGFSNLDSFLMYNDLVDSENKIGN